MTQSTPDLLREAVGTLVRIDDWLTRPGVEASRALAEIRKLVLAYYERQGLPSLVGSQMQTETLNPKGEANSLHVEMETYDPCAHCLPADGDCDKCPNDKTRAHGQKATPAQRVVTEDELRAALAKGAEEAEEHARQMDDANAAGLAKLGDMRFRSDISTTTRGGK